MSPLGWKLGLGAALLVAIATGLFFAKRHYEGLLTQISTLQQDKGKLETAIATERSTVAQLKTRIGEWDEAYKKLAANQRQIIEVQKWATVETRRLNEIFAKHDLSRLAHAKPGLVERRINDGTARIIRLLECASDPGRECDTSGGADPTDVDSGDAPAAAGPSTGRVQGGNTGPSARRGLGLHRTAPPAVREPGTQSDGATALDPRSRDQLAAVQ